MHPLAHVFLIAALTIPTNTLVLRNGQRIDIDGSVTADSGRVTFRSGGSLFSVAEDEVDLDATRAAGVPATTRSDRPGKLKVTAEEKQRLLKELEDNHSGTPGLPAALHLSPGPTPQEREQATEDEWSWKRSAQSYQEAIRRAQENLDLLRDKAGALRAHIAGLLSLGYTPSQFSYDSTALAYTEEAIPSAELEVQRAQRAFDQFREEARRRDVPPGWLR